MTTIARYLLVSLLLSIVFSMNCFASESDSEINLSDIKPPEGYSYVCLFNANFSGDRGIPRPDVNIFLGKGLVNKEKVGLLKYKEFVLLRVENGGHRIFVSDEGLDYSRDSSWYAGPYWGYFSARLNHDIVFLELKPPMDTVGQDGGYDLQRVSADRFQRKFDANQLIAKINGSKPSRVATKNLVTENLAAKSHAAKKPRKESRYDVAVIIGNKNYSKHNADVPDVDYAHNDADAMYKYVKNTLGYRDGNIILMKDATQAEMVSVFGNMMTAKGKLYNWVRPGKGKVFVYYSGHGAPGISTGAGFLLPTNADPMTVELNGYPLETLYKNLTQVPAKKMTIVLDACFSGSSANGTIVQNASSIALKRIETKSIASNTNVFTAAGLAEVASWDKDRKMGLFTRFFIDGVNGVADSEDFGNGDGKVSLGELKSYLEDEVSYFARRNYYRDQHPQISGDENDVLSTLQ